MVTLNVNRLGTTTERKRLSEWIEKEEKTMHYLEEEHFKYKDMEMSRVKIWKALCILKVG